MKESELALKFIEFFNDQYEVYKEVPVAGSIVDFVAATDLIKIAVEVKLEFGLKVIEQAFYHRTYFNYSYVAVPKAKRGHSRHFIYKICRDLEIGVLEYNEISDEILEAVKPKLNRRKSKVKLLDYMKESVAGSQYDRITAFSNTIREIVNYLKRRQDGEKMDVVLNSVNFHWNTLSSAKSCIYQWCRKGVITEFRLENGRLYLIKKDDGIKVDQI